MVVGHNYDLAIGFVLCKVGRKEGPEEEEEEGGGMDGGGGAHGGRVGDFSLSLSPLLLGCACDIWEGEFESS